MEATNVQTTGSRRQILINRMLKTIEQWQKFKGSDIKIQILSAKYSKSLRYEGGFPEIIDELEAKGMIRIQLTETGARLVGLGSIQPVDTSAQLLEKTKLYF